MPARAHGGEGVRRRQRDRHQESDRHAERRIRFALFGRRRVALLGPRSRRALSASNPIFPLDRTGRAQAPDRGRSRPDRSRGIGIREGAGHQAYGGCGPAVRLVQETVMKTRVLIIDDSALMRGLLSSLLSEDPDIEVVDAAPDPLVAREMIKAHNPDVVTLDVEMPRMDGLTFLRKIMTLRPMPVVMISTLTQAGAEVTLEALEIGAVDFVAKPTNAVGPAMAALAGELRAKVKAAARTRVRARPLQPAPRPPLRQRLERHTGKILMIGASTGGVEALKTLLMDLPQDCPPTLVTQHMPERFTAAFA